jgi:FdhD protein
MDEAPFWISVNGERRVLLTCWPGEPAALAVGHLVAEGWALDARSVLGWAVRAGPGRCTGVDAEVEPAQVADAERLRRHQLEHGCGLRHFLDCEPIPRAHRSPAPDDLAGVFRSLFEAADAAAPEGGVHAAGLTDGSSLLSVSVDVARHCAVDRVIGQAVIAGRHAPLPGLVTTSRISGSMALKAIRAGVAWAASRSLATPLARELAAAAGLTLVEKAARRHGGSGP